MIFVRSFLAVCLAFATLVSAHAQSGNGGGGSGSSVAASGNGVGTSGNGVGISSNGIGQKAGGAGGFCLFQLPPEQNSSPRWINLAIVQFVEAAPRELRITYGGGNFGSGHEARIPVAHADEALAHLERMRQAAAACR